MLKSIKILLLRNIEFIIFANNIVQAIERIGAATLNIAAELADFKTKKESVEAAHKKLQSNPITEELAALDGQRDQAAKGILTVVDGYSRHFTPEIADAAKLIQLHLKPYGSQVTEQNYQAETGTIQEIIADWENKPELVSALALLNLTTWKNELKTLNTAFNEKFLDRSHEYGSESPVTLKQRREIATQSYYELRDMLDAYARINKNSADFQAAVNDINAIIGHYNQLVENRQNNSDSSNPEENEESETGTGTGEEITPQPLP